MEAGKRKILDSAEQITAYVKEQEQPTAAEPGKDMVHLAFRQFENNFDKKNGGFGGAPKFPTPHNLMFLLEYGIRENSREALDMAETTLTQMYRGGIFDHIGGGFSRYSTDDRWLAPHFEKMLYDNALLAIAYLAAYSRTGRKLYECVARKVLGYVERELTDAQGGFYCGQDADSDGVEGKYYVFTQEEIRRILGQEEGDAFACGMGLPRMAILKERAYRTFWKIKIMKGSVRNNAAVTAEAIWTELEEKPSKSFMNIVSGVHRFIRMIKYWFPGMAG